MISLMLGTSLSARNAAFQRCLSLPGSSGNYASAPDSAPLSVTGAIELVADVALTSWVPATTQTLISKHNATGNQRGYLFRVNSLTGLGNLFISADGITGQSVNSSATIASAGVVAGQRAAVKVTWRPSDQRVQFFLASTFGGAWTQLGTDVTLPGAQAGIFDNTEPLQLGMSAGNASPMVGKYYRARVYNGIGGTLAFDANFNTNVGALSVTDAANGATVTINQSGSPAAAIVIG